MAVHFRVWLALLLAGLISPAAGRAAEKRVTVPVMDFHTEGIGGKVALQITSAVVEAFSVCIANILSNLRDGPRVIASSGSGSRESGRAG